MKEIITAFRDSGLGIRAFNNMESAEKWLSSQKSETNVMCPYAGNYRLISKAVCDFHKEKQDGECESCQPINKGRVIKDSILMMKNDSIKDAADLSPGRYVPDGHGGWKFKARLTGKERSEPFLHTQRSHLNESV